MIDIITYNDKTVQALYDAVLYNAIQGDGILQGLNIDLQPQGSSITIENGYGLIQGRVFKIEQEEVAVDMPVSETAGQIIIKIDLSSTEEPISVFSDNTMRPLQQDTNFNVLNGIYEVQFATYRVSGTGITNVVHKFERVIPTDEVNANFNIFKTNTNNQINSIKNKEIKSINAGGSVSINNISYVKVVNGVCYFQIFVNLSADKPAYGTNYIVTGMPIPPDECNFIAGSRPNGVSTCYPVYLNRKGQISSRSRIPKGTELLITGSYVL